MYTKAESDSLKNKKSYCGLTCFATFRIGSAPSGKTINRKKKIALYIMIYHFCKRVGGTCIPKQ
jgi:hypothetical protein